MVSQESTWLPHEARQMGLSLEVFCILPLGLQLYFLFVYPFLTNILRCHRLSGKTRVTRKIVTWFTYERSLLNTLNWFSALKEVHRSQSIIGPVMNFVTHFCRNLWGVWCRLPCVRLRRTALFQKWLSLWSSKELFGADNWKFLIHGIL